MQDTWPSDADGDVFRRLASDDFDFSMSHSIDFNVDFDSWPPSPDLVTVLKNQYPKLRVFEPRDGYRGYIQFVVDAKLTYELVMFVQSEVSALVRSYGGICESWGVMNK
ncbi:MAG: ribonuclease E inhibitor RraB [Dechloromonas sp.]|nr:MAG: ribonuclease E inhibitor RraB [Dechloromonas sp.]